MLGKAFKITAGKNLLSITKITFRWGGGGGGCILFAKVIVTKKILALSLQKPSRKKPSFIEEKDLSKERLFVFLRLEARKLPEYLRTGLFSKEKFRERERRAVPKVGEQGEFLLERRRRSKECDQTATPRGENSRDGRKKEMKQEGKREGTVSGFARGASSNEEKPRKGRVTVDSFGKRKKTAAARGRGKRN